MGETLKSCPFCGGKAYLAFPEEGCYARCKTLDCDATGPMRRTPSEATEAWNRRPEPPTPPETPPKLTYERAIELIQMGCGDCLMGPNPYWHPEGSSCPTSATGGVNDPRQQAADGRVSPAPVGVDRDGSAPTLAAQGPTSGARRKLYQVSVGNGCWETVPSRVEVTENDDGTLSCRTDGGRTTFKSWRLVEAAPTGKLGEET